MIYFSNKNKSIGLCEPEVRGNEWAYVKECLDTRWVSSVGKFVNLFESKVAQYVDAKHAVACVNGTSALHVALLVCGVKPEDEVIVPAISFVAPANAVRYCGAWPVFIDVEDRYWQLDMAKLEDFLKKKCRVQAGKLINTVTKRNVSALLPVHVMGHPVEMAPLLKLARRYRLKVIEDASESLGSKYAQQHTGTFGDCGIFSFNGNKIITTGGGGMVVTSSAKLADRVRYLTTQAKNDPVEYIHEEVGYNYRLTNLQAAVGVAQMELLEEFVLAKRRLAQRYDRAFHAREGILIPSDSPQARWNAWLYTIRVNAKKYKETSRQLIQRLKANMIEARPVWHPLSGLKIFSSCYAHAIEVAPRLYAEAVSLPSSVGLTVEQQDKVIKLITHPN